MRRLFWLAMGITIGVLAGFMMPRQPSGTPHLIAASGVWLSYAALLSIRARRAACRRASAAA